MESEHCNNSVSTFPVTPDMPLPSSLAFQACNPFPSVVKLGKSSCLGWRAMNHDHEALRTPTLPLLFCFHIRDNSPVGCSSDPSPSFSVTRSFRNALVKSRIVLGAREEGCGSLCTLKRSPKAGECIVEAGVPTLSHSKLLWVQFSHVERTGSPVKTVHSCGPEAF